MADLTKYVHTGLSAGDKLGIYANRTPRVGEGTLKELAPLRLTMSGGGELKPIAKAEGTITIIMPDLAPQGTCTLVIKASGHLFGKPFSTDSTITCTYRTEAGSKPKLFIKHDRGELELHNRDRSWTWVGPGIRGLPWIGLWPEDAALTVADVVGDIG